jgi:hypothetical protein
MKEEVLGFAGSERWVLVLSVAVSGLFGCEGESTVSGGDDETAGSSGASAGDSGAGGTSDGDSNGGGPRGGGSGAGAGGRALLGGAGIGGLAGASGASTGGNGASGAGGLPAAPWAPRGVFGDAIDEFVRARTSYAQAICCAAYCCDDPTNLDAATSCLAAEYTNFVPTAGWLACASRLALQDAGVTAWLLQEAGCWNQCATPNWLAVCPMNSIVFCECNSPEPTVLAACQSRGHVFECPGDTSDPYAFRRCDGIDDCADAFDEKNCDPTAPSFRCAWGELVPWLSLCDGMPACSDGTDEHGCVPNSSF